jgi:hypothetical protein
MESTTALLGDKRVYGDSSFFMYASSLALEAIEDLLAIYNDTRKI